MRSELHQCHSNDGVTATGNLLEARFHAELELTRRCKQLSKAFPNAPKRMSLLSPGSYSLAQSFSFMCFDALLFCPTSQGFSLSYQVRFGHVEEEESDLLYEK
ncbi:unnamed protein product [Hymenolepis diminuta]|uniref:Uncharacterized protein n=1 Tax=Hymenolepis diminuta TaxID=6216 RepID=A0A564ZCT5_HYMDI|nr:unnamed protein product [Hymenolepis diminuta]